MVKVISLSNDAYDRLKSIKDNKSFSEIVVELIECKKKKRDISKFAGIFKNDEEWGKIMDNIEKDRKNFKLREVKF
ncbi:MAG: antitoxin VapB family protein [Candidatus Pacearchaeota archaeon]